MANSSYSFLEIRFKIEESWTTCFVALSPASDGMLGVAGWHAQRFPATVSILEILQKHIGDAVLWPQEAP